MSKRKKRKKRLAIMSVEQTAAKSTRTYSFSNKKIHPPCHEGVKEVHENLFCCKLSDVKDVTKITNMVDVLVPLAELEGSVWQRGFRGEILYYPISDFDILPSDILERAVQEIINRLDEGKKVCIFCLGGHGRTGYMTAAVLGRLGYDDPIAFIRSNYCKSAVETNSQVKHLADFLDSPVLAELYKVVGSHYFEDYDFPFAYSRDYLGYANVQRITPQYDRCGMCKHFSESRCLLFSGVFVGSSYNACDDFSERE